MPRRCTMKDKMRTTKSSLYHIESAQRIFHKLIIMQEFIFYTWNLWDHLVSRELKAIWTTQYRKTILYSPTFSWVIPTWVYTNPPPHDTTIPCNDR